MERSTACCLSKPFSSALHSSLSLCSSPSPCSSQSPLILTRSTLAYCRLAELVGPTEALRLFLTREEINDGTHPFVDFSAPEGVTALTHTQSLIGKRGREGKREQKICRALLR